MFMRSVYTTLLYYDVPPVPLKLSKGATETERAAVRKDYIFSI